MRNAAILIAVVLLALLFPWCLVRGGEGASEPPASRIPPVLQHLLDKADPFGFEGAEIDRMDVDVTGDAILDIFLSNSETKGNAGQDWHIYLRAEGSCDVVYAGHLFFDDRGFRYDKETGEVVIWFRESGSKGYVAYYKIGDGQIKGLRSAGPLISEEEGGTGAFEEEWKKFAAWDEKAQPLRASISLEEFLAAATQESTAPIEWSVWGANPPPKESLVDLRKCFVVQAAD